MEIFSKSTNDTKKLAERVAQNLKAGDIILLYGNLGSGKTTFTQFLAEALESKDKVVSPTFILVREYKCKRNGIKKINHLDLYRITDEEEITKGGFLDFLNEPESISIIEWPEKIEKFIPALFCHPELVSGSSRGCIKITFEYVSENERKINVSNLH